MKEERKELKVMNQQTDELTEFLFEYLSNEIYDDLYPQRVIVPYLREKFKDHGTPIERQLSDPDCPSSSSDSNMTVFDGDCLISETTTEVEHQLCIESDSKSTLRYVNEIINEIGR